MEGELWEGAFLSYIAWVSRFLISTAEKGENNQKGEESSSAEQSPGVVCSRLISGKVREESSQQERIFN